MTAIGVTKRLRGVFGVQTESSKIHSTWMTAWNKPWKYQWYTWCMLHLLVSRGIARGVFILGITGLACRTLVVVVGMVVVVIFSANLKMWLLVIGYQLVTYAVLLVIVMDQSPASVSGLNCLILTAHPPSDAYLDTKLILSLSKLWKTPATTHKKCYIIVGCTSHVILRWSTWLIFIPFKKTIRLGL